MQSRGSRGRLSPADGTGPLHETHSINAQHSVTATLNLPALHSYGAFQNRLLMCTGLIELSVAGELKLDCAASMQNSLHLLVDPKQHCGVQQLRSALQQTRH